MTTEESEPPPRRLVPISQTISVLPTNTARVYTNIHPVLILALYCICFPSLVANPVSTLKKALAPLAHLQITYCVVCLPPFVGNSTPRAESPKPPKKKKVQFAHSTKGPAAKPLTLASRITVSRSDCQCSISKLICAIALVQPAIYSLILSLLLSTPLLTIIIILFGASVNSYLWHTLLCAAHMSLLGVLPLFYTRGVDSRMWREIAAASLPFDEVWGALIGTVVGAWVGAV